MNYKISLLIFILKINLFAARIWLLWFQYFTKRFELSKIGNIMT